MFLSLAGMNSGRYRSDFKEVQRLGHGSFSTVYRCIHRLDGTQYAIKHVKKNLNTSNADIAQALQEEDGLAAPFLSRRRRGLKVVLDADDSDAALVRHLLELPQHR